MRHGVVVVIVAVVLILLGGGVVVYQGTRGWRNNNPFNLRKSADSWVGLAPTQTDDSFFQFKELKYGIRAGLIVLKNYSTHYGLDTVRGIINRFAPSSENDTNAYIADVANALGVAPDESFDVLARIGDLGVAIMRHENGIMAPSWSSAMAEGLVLAGMPDQAKAFA